MTRMSHNDPNEPEWAKRCCKSHYAQTILWSLLVLNVLFQNKARNNKDKLKLQTYIKIQ